MVANGRFRDVRLSEWGGGHESAIHTAEAARTDVKPEGFKVLKLSNCSRATKTPRGFQSWPKRRTRKNQRPSLHGQEPSNARTLGRTFKRHGRRPRSHSATPRWHRQLVGYRH